MRTMVEGGKVAINLNGEIGAYFKSYKGLRQGDPLSPMLFNLVGDALSEILNMAKVKGIVKGLVPELVEGGLTHLQYADDTILFLQCLDAEIKNLKFLLFGYEEMSGMRINYAKSEVFTIGLEEEVSNRIATQLNCNLGKFPMKYLGIPIGDRRLTKDVMNIPAEKVQKKLETWKCSQLSYGGKAILI